MSDSGLSHSWYPGEKINHVLGILGLPALPDHVMLSFVTCILLISLGFAARRSISLIPSGLQNVVETLFERLEGLLIDAIGPTGPQYFPVIATLALFIALSNLMGIIPFLGSPTNNINVTLGCALFIFFYYHLQGIKRQGFTAYMRHFTGPMLMLAPLFVPLEIVSHLSRVMSLSIRLFGNIMGEDTILLILFLMSPWYLPIPVPMMMFVIFTSILQAFIFIMLSMMYIAGAVADEGH